MTGAVAVDGPTKVLIVDDNKIYRDAFRRNLQLQKYNVVEAEDMPEALEKIKSDQPHVVITDLQMRTEKEGLDLIREIKSTYPLLPVIMISAVGTFEEGALAQKFGAADVISKSRIEEEIGRLYTSIESARAGLARSREADLVVQRARAAASAEDADTSGSLDALRTLLADPQLHPYLREEAYSLATALGGRQMRDEAIASAQGAAGGVLQGNLEPVENVLRAQLAAYDTYAEDSRETLRIAEFLYEQQTNTPGSIDFSRNIGFSYCFAVENEAKLRMARRLQKFLSCDGTYALVTEMMEQNNQHLSVYYHQYMLMLQRTNPMDFTIDNVRQTFRRILEHQSRYKPDGLKALGIMILVFGRSYQWTKNNKPMKVSNPLGIKGLETDADVIRFAELLVSLQHYRNPYIHPEISDLEKLSKIRSTAFECLNMASRLQ